MKVEEGSVATTKSFMRPVGCLNLEIRSNYLASRVPNISLMSQNSLLGHLAN